jgi:glycerol-3-phosphate cytidylyltransferase
MKRILTYGTYDLLHYGHIRLLQRAKALGDYLIVALSTDEFNAIKGKKAYHDYETRKKMLEAVRYVDLVIPEENWEQKINDVKEYHVDVVVMGSDWAGSDRFDYLKDYCEVVYLDRTEGISTTKIKEDLGLMEPKKPGESLPDPEDSETEKKNKKNSRK